MYLIRETFGDPFISDHSKNHQETRTYFSWTQTRESIKSFGLSLQELHFVVCNIRKSPLSEIKQTAPPPSLLSLHSDIPAFELQLAELHIQLHKLHAHLP
ncbi:hypothetical protein AMECASPLE_035890 [Ameca splendens]|uniref:Uncharacterized protein n=1 Tax=Ameca splendens TaxID=208324 RepID=A0ABV0YVW6_9TELE